MRTGWILLVVCVVSTLSIATIGLVGSAQPGSRSKLWQTDFSNAQAKAKRLGRPLFIHFYADWCEPCRRMQKEVFNSPELSQHLGRRFVLVRLDSDLNPELAERFGVHSLPSDVFVDPDGRVIARLSGYQDKRSYLSRLAGVVARATNPQKMRFAKDTHQTMDDSAADHLGDGRRHAALPQRGRRRKSSKFKFKDVNDRLLAPTPAKWRKVSIGLNGYSPVGLWKRRVWRKGAKPFAWPHKEVVYYMASGDELREFQQNPARYAPRLQGCDPVILWETDCAVPGSTEFGAYFDGELYLFADAETRMRFKQNPLRYSRARHVLRGKKAEQIHRSPLNSLRLQDFASNI